MNNAGIYEFAPLEQITEEHFHKQFNLNVLGLLLTTQEALKYFTPAGGSVVNVSSLVMHTGRRQTPPFYSATKGAVDTITASLAKELGSRKIRVNTINPGMVETEGTHTGGFTTGDMHDQYVANAPLGRIGQPQDIATAVTFLASDDSSWVTGETLLVSGGHR